MTKIRQKKSREKLQKLESRKVGPLAFHWRNVIFLYCPFKLLNKKIEKQRCSKKHYCRAKNDRTISIKEVARRANGDVGGARKPRMIFRRLRIVAPNVGKGVGMTCSL